MRALSSPSASKSRRIEADRESSERCEYDPAVPDIACDKSPINQNSMPFNWALGASTRMKLMTQTSLPTAPRRSLAADILSSHRRDKSDRNDHDRAHRSGECRACITAAPAPSVIASSAPSDAPPETPST